MTDSEETQTPTDNPNLENLPAPVGVTSGNTEDLETPPTSHKLMTGNIDDIQLECDNSEAQIDKFNSSSHANLCFAGGILHLIVTLCRFIPIQLEETQETMTFVVTLSILIVVTGIITIRGHKDSKNLKIVGRYLLCFLLFMFPSFNEILQFVRAP